MMKDGDDDDDDDLKAILTDASSQVHLHNKVMWTCEALWFSAQISILGGPGLHAIIELIWHMLLMMSFKFGLSLKKLRTTEPNWIAKNLRTERFFLHYLFYLFFCVWPSVS